ncbi:Calcineurin-like phosphoesterase superfamily domain protein [Rosistilla carotiformis]|uniref:Calcineurin-like phosphoesterase superfamily domain protein n=1 Tax=Rosistilla carotiformis TaxID=2528017 RepID=A0A518JZX5_9BACT|nr:metallophosphoesterase family protein [Rosistilla carotiformis]QDV71098.1 Calcineurin-like phosphoesterase superfamily domain protein [Rosistilla carotiformis]
MKLLLFSDLHCDQDAARALVELAKQADVIVGAGDFAIKRKGLADTIEILQTVDCPAILVPGNGESVEELTQACRDWPQAHVLHGTSARVAGFVFFGIGGGIPTTPFGDWSYDFSEEEAVALLKPMAAGSILVTHSPPWNCVDIDGSGTHRGSQSIRQAIEAKQPPLVVCGHVHDSWEQTDHIGDATVINAGPRGVWHPIG